MVIKKNSWHYKVWSFSHKLWEDSRFAPTSVSLCSYVRQIVLSPFNLLLWLLAVGIFGAGFGVVLILQTIMGLLTGSLPDDWKRFDQRSYNGLKIGRLELFPIHFILVAALIWAFKMLTSVNVFWIGGPIIGVAALMIVVASLWNSDTMTLIKSWFSAKKQGVCPLITFQDK